MSCAVCEDGAAVCWSYDESAEVSLPRAAVDVAVGFERACILDEAGAVHCFTEATTATPLTEAAPGAVERLLHGTDHPCGVATDERVQCWGGKKTVLTGLEVDRAFGGDDFGCSTHDGVLRCWIAERDEVRSEYPVLEPVVAVDGYRDQGEAGCNIWDEIGVCAVTEAGKVFCKNTNSSAFELDVVPGVDGAIDVQVEKGSTCALLRDGQVACWGRGAPGLSLEPHGVADAEWIESDYSSLCVRRRSGDLACWGPLGGWDVPRDKGIVIEGLEDPSALTVGSESACALVQGGQVWCWGSSAHDRAEQPAIPYRRFAKGLGFEALAAGTRRVCAARDALVRCEDLNGGEEQAFQLPSPVTELQAGAGFFCARTDAGGLHCWGRNIGGQLGDGTRDARESPVRPLIPETIRSVAVAEQSVCAVGLSGKLYCWGRYRYRRPPDPQDSAAVLVPERAAKGTFDGVTRRGREVCPYTANWTRCRTFGDYAKREKWRRVGAAEYSGGFRECSLDREGRVECGSEDQRHHVALPPVRLLVGRGGSECAVTEAGQVVCWGGLGHTLQPLLPRPIRPSFGALGDGSLSAVSKP